MDEHFRKKGARERKEEGRERKKEGRERKKEGRERKKMKEREHGGGEREEEIEGGGEEGWNVDRDTFQNEQRERVRVREMDS